MLSTLLTFIFGDAGCRSGTRESAAQRLVLTGLAPERTRRSARGVRGAGSARRRRRRRAGSAERAAGAAEAGGGRRGRCAALRGAARRWAAGARGRRGSGRRALHARERRAPSSRAFRRRPCHLLPITTALGAGAVAPATQRPDLKESRGDDGLQAAPRGPLLAVRRLAQNAQVDSAGAPLGQLDWTWCAKLGAESEGHQQGSARRCPSP